MRTAAATALLAQRRHAGQDRAFQKFQTRAAAGAHERHLVAQFGFVERLHAVAAADDALRAVLLRRVRHGLRDGVRAGGKLLVLEQTHRAVPQNRLRSGHHIRIRLDRRRADVQAGRISPDNSCPNSCADSAIR